MPNRALAIYRRQRHFLALPFRPRLARTLAILVRRDRSPGTELRDFLQRLPFGLES